MRRLGTRGLACFGCSVREPWYAFVQDAMRFSVLMAGSLGVVLAILLISGEADIEWLTFAVWFGMSLATGLLVAILFAYFRAVERINPIAFRIALLALPLIGLGLLIAWGLRQ